MRFPVKGKPADVDITAEMKKACESVVGPIAETMLDLLSKVEPEYQEKVQRNDRPRGRRLADSRPRGGAREGAPRGRRRAGASAVEDPVFAGANGGLAIAVDAPEGEWEPLGA